MISELELYIHIPFCVKKCSYCDFLSFPAEAKIQEAYIRQLINEIRAYAPFGRDRIVRSVFLGGGTPSLLEPGLITQIMSAVRHSFCVSKDAEITIECNPGSTLRHKFSVYREAGINRLSIGLQSAENTELRMLGRIHTYEEFLKCYQGARMEGFDNINVDLINCIPMQTMKTWKKTLRQVVMLRPEHLSVYNLIVEEGTPYYEMQEKGLLMLPDEDEQAEIDGFTREFLAKNGYKRYEISNYAREGRECIHNIGYWTEVPYLGFGLGAASYYEGVRWSDTRDIGEYLEADFGAADTLDKIRKDKHSLDEKEQMEEFMFLGLRMVNGISETDFLRKFGKTLQNTYGSVIEKYLENGLIQKDGYRYRLSEHGMDISNSILNDFLLE
ncbi:MAG TPA: oxygen-independent coproporphyrinogen III oxidase [Candidatus Avilachnospira avistercoris]|nr:oxygen-independent coproporphyrinogen III oxidase [Candidatus Avilachnospira avistercoris]